MVGASDRNSGEAAERRAERIRWRGRSRLIGGASRDMDERLREMNGRAGALDKRLLRQAKARALWQRKRDDPSRSANPDPALGLGGRT